MNPPQSLTPKKTAGRNRRQEQQQKRTERPSTKQTASAEPAAKSRSGRPPIPDSEKRTIQQPIRFNEKEHGLIAAKAEACRLTFAEFTRESALGSRVLRSPAPDINYQMWTRLADVGIEVRTMYDMIRAVWLDHLYEQDIDLLVQQAARGELVGHFDLYGVLARLMRINADLESLKAAVMGRTDGFFTARKSPAEPSPGEREEAEGQSDSDAEQIPERIPEAPSDGHGHQSGSWLSLD